MNRKAQNQQSTFETRTMYILERSGSSDRKIGNNNIHIPTPTIRMREGRQKFGMQEVLDKPSTL